MFQIQETIVSPDLFDKYFVCDYATCQGICCVEGESGAPLEAGEADLLRRHLDAVRDMLAPEALEVIDKQGVSYLDVERDEVTSIVNGRDCVFTTYDENGNCLCAFERAYRSGKIDFPKPLSCHLYPVRLTRYSGFTAVNYHRWEICRCAEALGRQTGTPLYRFLKEPLIRAFGEEWYREMEEIAALLEQNPLKR